MKIIEQAMDILEGHVNELVNRNEGLAEQRLAICRECPIFKDSGRIKCDSSKYISPDGKDWSYSYKTGYKKGCGCYLNSKVRVPGAKCIIGKW